MELPLPFQEQMQQLLGKEYAAFKDALDQPSATSIRINPSKFSSPLPYPKVPWSQFGYYLLERPLFTADPLFHAGAYYVQEASSMMLEAVLNQLDLPYATVALDLCAAPGGKSTHLYSLLSEYSFLVSNEVIRNRSGILAENIQKWGASRAMVTNNDPKDFGNLPPLFDLIIVDAPCSGEGMFRKDPKAVEEWSPEQVDYCVNRQQRIVEDVWPSLKPGGYLIYSTCTYNQKENEDNLDWAIEHLPAESLEINLPADWGIEKRPGKKAKGYSLYPHRVQGEGFFFGVLQKPDKGQEPELTKVKRPVFQAAPKEWTSAFKNAFTSQVTWYSFQNRLFALPTHHVERIQLLSERLRPVYVATEVAEWNKTIYKPSPSLALNPELGANLFEQIALNPQQVLAYLQRQELNIPGTYKGWTLATWQGIAIGWGKAVNGRLKNHYPKAWQIRMNTEGLEPINVLQHA